MHDIMVRSKDPKPSGSLKIQDKLKIIKLQAEEPHLSMRKLTDLVKIRLGLQLRQFVNNFD